MPSALTDMERDILDFMVGYLRENTYQPSIREIGERFGIKSTKTVSEHLQALAEKGYLERDPSRSRGVRILGVDLNTRTVSVPCYVELPEGEAPGPELPREYLSLDRRLVGEEGAFFVRARGDELGLLGVADGDLVLLEPTRVEAVPEGAVVAARSGNSARFFRLSRTGRTVLLHPTHAGLGPMVVEEPERLALLGRVAAVYRRLDGAVSVPGLTAH